MDYTNTRKHFTMIKRIRVKNIVILFILMLFFRELPAQELIVAAAANVQFAMEALKQEFEKESGIDLKIITNSSGKLTAQITNGAPFDIFLSADMKYPESLFASGQADSLPKIYAYGTLVLWTMEDFDLSAGVSILTKEQIHKIAIADPRNAPYGRAAEEILKFYNLYEKVKAKLVYGRSISQANQYIVSRAAAGGFSAKSVVLSPEMKGRGKWIEIDSAAYTPIAQGAVILKYGKKNHPEAARAFFDFLFSEAAGAILQNYGYRLP